MSESPIGTAALERRSFGAATADDQLGFTLPAIEGQPPYLRAELTGHLRTGTPQPRPVPGTTADRLTARHRTQRPGRSTVDA